MALTHNLKLWLLLLLAGHSAQSCPCVWSSENNLLDCHDLGLRGIPQDCFQEFPSAGMVDLSLNNIDRIFKDDFQGLENVQEINLAMNKLFSIHFRAFHNLSLLESLYLDSNNLEVLPDDMLMNQVSLKHFSAANNSLTRLPVSLFNPGLGDGAIIDLTLNSLRVLPCSTMSVLPSTTNVLADEAVKLWAPTVTELAECSTSGVASLCMPVNTNAKDTDCSTLPEQFTALKAVLAETEARDVYGSNPDHMVFAAALENLLSEPPVPVSCLPDDLDVASAFYLFHQHAKDVHLEVLTFDLADLPRFTSNITESVTILADTVILTRPLPPLRYHLTISARQIALAHPILMVAPTLKYQPGVVQDFYEPHVSTGKVNGVVVVEYIHGYVTARVLDGTALASAQSCNPLPQYTEDQVRQWVSARQLWLSLYCGHTLRESRTSTDLYYAQNIGSYVVRLTTNWTNIDMLATNQWANDLVYDTHAALTGMAVPRDVPYLSVDVYAQMMPHLADSIALYKDAHDNLKNKLMINAEKLFDMNIHFEERKADLEFMQSNADRAVEAAEAVHDAHESQMQNHVSWATTVWGGVMGIYQEVLKAREPIDDAVKRAEKGLKAYKRRQRFKSFLNIGTTITRCIITGGVGVAGAAGIVNNVGEVVHNAYEFMSYNERMEDMEAMIKDINREMVKIDKFMVMVPPIPPPEGDQIGWLMMFNNSDVMYDIARGASVTAEKWSHVNIYTNKCLDDEEFSDKVDGIKNLRIKLNELMQPTKALAEQVQAFCEYVSTVLEEVNNLANDATAIEQSQTALETVNNMLVDEAVTEANYKEHMTEQNLALLSVMMNLFLKSRTDMLAIHHILTQYCQAYFYTFFKDCDPSNSPSLWDNYDAVLYKLNKIQFESLNSISSLSPPPQPLTKTIVVQDSVSGCHDGMPTLEDTRCPVSSMVSTGSTSFNLVNHWGPGLHYAARIRLDRVRIYLSGLQEPEVTMDVQRPAIFNDTYQGQEFTFRGHIEDCRIKYEMTGTSQEPSFVTDCSTDEIFQRYYYRTSPDGVFTFTWQEYQAGRDYSNLTALHVDLEGSWILNI